MSKFKSEVRKFVHAQHTAFVNASTSYAAWVRTRPVTLERSIYEDVKDGLEDGAVDVVISLSVNEPGFPPMLGLGVQFVDVPGTEEVEGSVYYVSAFEVGPKMHHHILAPLRFSDQEHVTEPPTWLELTPPPPDPETEDGSDSEDDVHAKGTSCSCDWDALCKCTRPGDCDCRCDCVEE